jgi:hypothetical protein
MCRLMNHILDVQSVYQQYTSFGLKHDEAKSLVHLNEASNEGPNQISKESFPVPRFKIPLDHIMFLNNLETDARYKQWPSDISYILSPRYPGQLIYMRKNLATTIYVFDVTHKESVRKSKSTLYTSEIEIYCLII